MKKVIMGNHALSYGAMLSRSQVISAYPITPQTQVVELLSEMCADGRSTPVHQGRVRALRHGLVHWRVGRRGAAFTPHRPKAWP